MTAAIYNFTLEQKVTFHRLLTYKDARGFPVDLTGYEARMQIRDQAGEVVATLTDTNGGIVLGGPEGTIQLNISETETSLMTFATALYDLKLIAPDGMSMRLLQGKVTLSIGQTV